MSTVSFTSTNQLIFQDYFLQNFQSRKLLLNSLIYQQQIIAPPPPNPAGENTFESNVIVVLSVLLCALICSVGLAAVVKCTIFRCSRFASSESSANSSARVTINRGIKQKALKTFPTVKYSAEMKPPGLDTECVICLTEFASGERLRLLPKCNHGFHVGCIDKWLKSHSSCPKCRHCLIETCQKIVRCSQVEATVGYSATICTAVQEPVVSILPLEREGMLRDCRGIS